MPFSCCRLSFASEKYGLDFIPGTFEVHFCTWGNDSETCLYYFVSNYKHETSWWGQGNTRGEWFLSKNQTEMNERMLDVLGDSRTFSTIEDVVRMILRLQVPKANRQAGPEGSQFLLLYGDRHVLANHESQRLVILSGFFFFLSCLNWTLKLPPDNDCF